MGMIQSMEKEIEFLTDQEPQKTVEQSQQPLKLVEPAEEMPPQQEPRPPAETPPTPLPLTAEQGEEILRLLRALPAQAVANERAAIHRDLSQIPTVRRYFVLCLLSVLLSSTISVGIFGLAWQKSRPDSITIKAAQTFHSIWSRASDQEKRQIKKIIVRQISSQQAPTPPTKKR